ncbi:MAG: putative quinol monooxygenase [Gemmataceae bacterium]
MLTALALSLSLALLPAQPPENPILTSIKAKLKHPDKPFTTVVNVKVKAGMEAKFEAAFAECQKATRKEPGCKSYDLNRDADHPEQYLLFERWKSADALASHLKAAHTTKLLAAMGDLLDGPPEIKVYVVIGD